MRNINIEIKDRVATVEKNAFLLCGNTDQTVTFSFDAEWNAITSKTALFVYSEEGMTKFKKKRFSGNSIKAPLLTNVSTVRVGVIGGEIMATTSVAVQSRSSILCDAKIRPEDIDDGYTEYVGADGFIDELLSSNIFNKAKVSSGLYVNVLTGEMTESEDYYATGFMPVEVGKTYTFKTYDFFGENKAVAALYSKDKTYIGYTDKDEASVFQNGVATLTLTPVISKEGYSAADVKYCRVNFASDDIDTFMFYSGSDYPEEYEPYSRVVKLDEDVQLSDSIISTLKEMFVSPETLNLSVKAATESAVLFSDENNKMSFQLASDGGLILKISKRTEETE